MLSEFTPYATIPASDMDRARKFYEEKLGLAPKEVTPAGVFYGAGERKFLLFISSGKASGAHTQMGWQVNDLASEVRALQGKGVAFEEYDFPTLKTENGIAEIAGGKAAWFRDSEGNLIGIAQLS